MANWIISAFEGLNTANTWFWASCIHLLALSPSHWFGLV